MQEVFYILRRLINSIFNDVNVWFSKIKCRSINHSRMKFEMAFYNVVCSISILVLCYDHEREGTRISQTRRISQRKRSPMRNFQELQT